MAQARETTFKNASDIDAFFKKYNSNGFTDWFNKNHASKEGFAAQGNRSAKKITGPDKWSQVWNHVKEIFGRDSINLVEFLSIDTIIINETGGSFKPLSEGVNKNSASSHPGVAYAFDTIPGLKKSYNTLTDVKNKTAYDLFRDSDFKTAHGHKPFGNILSDTTDTRWSTNTFPVGFSGGSTEKEVDRDLVSNSFISEADFQKFRGRGFIQSTGRSAYTKIIKFILGYTGANSTVLNYKSKWSQYGTNYDKIATISTNKDWDELFLNSDSVIPCFAVYAHGSAGGYLTIGTSDSQVKSGIRKVASKIAGANATAYIDLFEQRVLQQLNMIEGSAAQTQAATASTPPPSNTNQVDNTTPPPPADTFNTNGDDEDAAWKKFLADSSKEEINDNTSAQQQQPQNEQPSDSGSDGNVTNVLKPTVKVTPIVVDVGSESQTKSEIANNLGFYPFVWYNGIQIQYEDIRTFNLSSTELLPTVTVTFFDSTGLIDQAGFPLDDTRLKVFLNPRKVGFKPILIEFKIVNFTITANKTYVVDGVMSINRFFLKKYEAYSKQSSYAALLEFCKRAEIGFNSNIKDTDDSMNWINTGENGYDFVNSIIDHSYASDDGFMWGFVDFYYCFNYIDIETEFKKKIDTLDGLDGSGGMKSGLKVNNATDSQKLFLTNDKSMADSSNYFFNHTIMNNSTSVSLKKGYLNRVKFYDRNTLDFMVFDIDSITSEGDKTIIMKGSPQDEDYFKEHVTATLMGKLDSDNMHKNYHYAYVQNTQNIDDLTKIGIKLHLPNPNFNLHRFQKINVFVSNHTQKFAKDMINYRLSGDWLITDISFSFNSGVFKQEVNLVKRELGLSPAEIKQETASANANSSNKPNSNAQSSNTDPNSNVDPEYQKLFDEQERTGNTDIAFTEKGPELVPPAATASATASLTSPSATASSATASSKDIKITIEATGIYPSLLGIDKTTVNVATSNQNEYAVKKGTKQWDGRVLEYYTFKLSGSGKDFIAPTDGSGWDANTYQVVFDKYPLKKEVYNGEQYTPQTTYGGSSWSPGKGDEYTIYAEETSQIIRGTYIIRVKYNGAYFDGPTFTIK